MERLTTLHTTNVASQLDALYHVASRSPETDVSYNISAKQKIVDGRPVIYVNALDAESLDDTEVAMTIGRTTMDNPAGKDQPAMKFERPDGHPLRVIVVDGATHEDCDMFEPPAVVSVVGSLVVARVVGKEGDAQFPDAWFPFAHNINLRKLGRQPLGDNPEAVQRFLQEMITGVTNRYDNLTIPEEATSTSEFALIGPEIPPHI